MLSKSVFIFTIIGCVLNLPTIFGGTTESDSSSENFIPHGDSNSNDRITVIEVIPRSAWNATEPLFPSKSVNFSAINVIIDHSLTESCSDKESCCPLILSFQDFHMTGLERADIHYNFLISGDGSVYEGRGWNRSADVIEYSNDESIVISFIGNYRVEKPNEKQLSVARILIKDGLRLGKIESNYGLYGVRQFCDNDSPGNALFEIIQTWPHFSSTRKN